MFCVVELLISSSLLNFTTSATSSIICPGNNVLYVNEAVSKKDDTHLLVYTAFVQPVNLVPRLHTISQVVLAKRPNIQSYQLLQESWELYITLLAYNLTILSKCTITTTKLVPLNTLENKEKD